MDGKEIYENRTSLRTDCEPATDCTDLQCCPEELVFAMQDNHHQFSIGLSTVIHCLAIAERKGYVPELPPEWWHKMRHY